MNFETTELLMHVGLIPLYVLLGAARHEYSHAVSASLEGVIVRRVVFWPHWFRNWQDPQTLDFLYRVIYHPKDGYHFQFGVWIWGAGKQPTWKSHLMPYIVALGFVIAGFFVVPRVMEYDDKHGVLAAIILFWVSPAVDILYNIVKWLVKKRGDWEQVFPHG